MEELLKKLGINPNQNNAALIEELGKKQMEYLERLDNVEDENRRMQLDAELKQIESVITALSGNGNENVTGIKRDGFSDLKGQVEEEKESLSEEDPDLMVFYEVLNKFLHEDREKGFEMFMELVESGNPHAQSQLGGYYLTGEHVEQDYDKAVKLIKKAVEKNGIGAKYRLACCYHDGLGVEKDMAQARYWVEESAKDGYELAQMNVGYFYLWGTDGFEENPKVAVEWFKKAAEQGESEAQLRIAECYRDGIGVEQSHEEATIWFEKAAEAGNDESQVLLGNKYLKGLGVEQSKEKAIYWWKKAAYQRNLQAMEYLILFGVKP